MKGHRGELQARSEGLDAERILDSAMVIVNEGGVEALSMRRLGKALNVDPMAIYYHLPNKQAIIRGLVQRVFSEIEDALEIDPEASWQDQVRAWARTYRESARRHQSLIIHLVSHADAAGEQVMRVNEALYAALASSGMAPRYVIRSADLIVDYIHGVILGAHAPGSGTGDWRARFTDRAQSPGAEQLPAISSVFSSVPPEDMELDADFGLDVIVAGIEQAVLR